MAELLGAGLFAVMGASAILWGLGRWTRAPMPTRLAARGASRPAQAGAVFLFDGPDLVDATPAARRLMRAQAQRGSDLASVAALLGRRFGADLQSRLKALPAAGRLLVPSLAGPGVLEAEGGDGALRLTLRLGEAEEEALARLSLEAALDELGLLRALGEDAPQLVWTLDATGTVVWANRAYLQLNDLARAGRPVVPDATAVTAPFASARVAAEPSEPVDGQGDRAEAGPAAEAAPPGPDPQDGPQPPLRPEQAWPADPIFELPADLPDGQPDRRRLGVAVPGRADPAWFEVTSLRRGGGSVHFATDVSDLVAAEAARAHFVQTLAKTFAQLDTGLAIFDRQRRLALFNPAFMDLTGLPIGFLSGRPLVHSVLDRLRDAKILPEPRHYASWRDEIAALEAAAAEGGYCDTWSLPGGQTYRVTGRPFPDGALAFLFEDISDEVGLTRRFRAELGVAQAALDAVDEAVATFSPMGTLGLANAAYAALWGQAGFRDATLADEVDRWEEATGPSALWDALRAGEGAGSDRLRLPDGRALSVRTQPLPGGGQLVAFRVDPAARLASDGALEGVPGSPRPASTWIDGAAFGPLPAPDHAAPGAGADAPAREEAGFRSRRTHAAEPRAQAMAQAPSQPPAQPSDQPPGRAATRVPA